MTRLTPILIALLLVGCKPPEHPAVICIVGAVLLDGTGGPPISNSVVTIENGRIRAAGARTGLLVPPEADKIDGAGQFVMPAIVDVAREAAVHGIPIGRPADADSTPLLADIFSLRDARQMADRGVTSFLHMIRDTSPLDPAFVVRLRDLHIVFVPMLAQEHDPAVLAKAKRNTRQLAEGGVYMAVGSAGDPVGEMELLVEAGIAPAEVLLAATRNGALALHTIDQVGTIEPGKRASLLVLSANPAEDIDNVRKTARVMRDGRWINR